MDKRKILVAENDTNLVEMLRTRLEADNYDIITALTGPEVLDKVHSGLPDLIIMDVELPVMSGYQISTNLKHDFKYKRIPIILMGTQDNWKGKSYASATGAEDFVVRPLDYNDLLKRIQMCFSRSPMQKLSVSEFGRKKVVIADNDKALVQQLKNRLEAHSYVKPDKYTSVIAENGIEVMEIVRRDKPDLIVVGDDLDKMDGYKICRALKENNAFSKIPILILSNQSEEETEAEVKVAGADGYLIKPIDLPTFIKRVTWYIWKTA